MVERESDRRSMTCLQRRILVGVWRFILVLGKPGRTGMRRLYFIENTKLR